jgi:hypothetical protein
MSPVSQRERRWPRVVGAAAAAAAAVTGVGVVGGEWWGRAEEVPVGQGTASAAATPSARRSARQTSGPVTLLHEGQPGWTRGTSLPDPCTTGSGATIARAHGPSSTRIIRSDGEGGAAAVEALVTFPSTESAAAFLHDLTEAARSCEVESGFHKAVVQEVQGSWDEGVAIATGREISHAGGSSYTGSSAFVTVGVESTVALSLVDGGVAAQAPLTDAVPAAHVAAALPAIEHVHRQLCGSTPAGC